MLFYVTVIDLALSSVLISSTFITSISHINFPKVKRLIFSISFYLSFCCSILLFVIPPGNALDVKLLLMDRLYSGCAG